MPGGLSRPVPLLCAVLLIVSFYSPSKTAAVDPPSIRRCLVPRVLGKVFVHIQVFSIHAHYDGLYKMDVAFF